VKRRKPHPEGIVKALELLNTGTEGCCFVGDAPEDIEMGKSAGVITIGVVSEYITRNRIEGAKPDLLLENIDQLPATLANL
jgi:phosphoglycolate phosphatase-like HAD superfamily hydrolase